MFPLCTDKIHFNFIQEQEIKEKAPSVTDIRYFGTFVKFSSFRGYIQRNYRIACH